MNGLYKSLFIFCSGLGIGLVLFSGQNSNSSKGFEDQYTQAYHSDTLKTARPTLSFQKASDLDQAPTLAPPKNKAAKQAKPNYYSQSGIYGASNSRDQIPTAPPTHYGKANVPVLAETEELEDEEVQSEKAVAKASDKDLDDLKKQLEERQSEIDSLKQSDSKFKDSHSGVAAYSSFGVYGHIEEEPKNQETGSGGAYVGYNYNNQNKDDDDVDASEVLPNTFNIDGVNIANSLLANNKIRMDEYVDYMAMGLAATSASFQRSAISQLSSKLDAEAFEVLAQYSATAPAQLNQHLDSELVRHMKTNNGLRFLSRQIANAESSAASQLAVNTVGLILESDNISPELFDVLITDVFNSLNNLPQNHPSFNRGRQLSALIPSIINS